MSLNWNFQRGGGFKPKNPLRGEYGYFLEQHNATLHTTVTQCCFARMNREKNIRYLGKQS